MGETAIKLEEVNVTDEFLKEAENITEETKTDASVINLNRATDKAEIIEEPIPENIQKEQIDNVVKNAQVKQVIEAALADSLSPHEAYRSIEPDVDYSKSSHSLEGIDRIDKMKTFLGELTLLVDLLDNDTIDYKNLIEKQKTYIGSLELDLKKYKHESEEANKKILVLQEKLIRAEEKLDIVKKELLD